jgi:hypothetical protein
VQEANQSKHLGSEEAIALFRKPTATRTNSSAGSLVSNWSIKVLQIERQAYVMYMDSAMRLLTVTQ